MIGADDLLPALRQGRPWRGAWPLGLSEHLGYDKAQANYPGARQCQERDHVQDGGLVKMGSL